MQSNYTQCAIALCASILGSILITGCSDEDALKQGANLAANTESQNQEVPPFLATPVKPSLADLGVRLLPKTGSFNGDYYKITRGMDLLYFYANNSNGELDTAAIVEKVYPISDDLGDKKLASLIDQHRDGDQFSKRDTIKLIEPILNDKISRVSGIRNVTIDISSGLSLGDYDFERQGFLTNNSFKDESHEENSTPYKRGSIRFPDVIDHKLSIINASDFDLIKIPEDAAREISQYNGKYSSNVNFKLYGFIHSIAQDKNDSYKIKYVVMQVTKIDLVSNLLNDPVRTLATVEL